jgi:predicted Zn-dependent peptidase
VPVDLTLGRAGGPGTEISLMQDGGVLVRRSVLPGGIRVLTEQVPGVRSTTVGAWVAVGSRDELDGHHGSTHFLEHLLFKGTRRRDAMAIAEAFDAVGGEANASTGKEHTCYFARVLDADVPLAVDVIGDMITSALLDPEEFETERGVILEELAMNEDDPTDVVHEEFATLVLGDHPLGRPIGGTPGTIQAVPREAVWDHYRRTYVPRELVVTAAGSVDHDALCALVLRAVTDGGWVLDPTGVPVDRRSGGLGPGVPVLAGAARTVHRPTEQANVVLGGRGPDANDDRRFALRVLHAVLGGGMSSRLFQEIREKRGLAYSVYSFASGYAEAGLFGMYAGCTPSRVEQVVELLGSELDRFAADGITAAELERAIGQLSGGLVLGLEDTGSRMSRLGRAEIVHGELLSVEELLGRIRAVTRHAVNDLAAELATAPRSLVVVGPFEDDVAAAALRAATAASR